MILIAVMVALSAVGSLIFAWAPSVKPVTALVILTAMYFGPQAGFMTGALTAVISVSYTHLDVYKRQVYLTATDMS